MKKIILLTLVSALLSSSAVSVSASRKRNAQNEVVDDVVEERMTMEEYANQDYAENLPGKGKNKSTAYDGYHYNGVPIDVPDFSRFSDFAPEEINTFSDAVVDYLGWDILLGTSDWIDNENCFYFKPIQGLSSATNQVFGYGRKKFGEGEIKFKAKIKNDSGDFSSGWLGLSFRCTTTQALQWGGNPGYMIIVKPNVVEMQKWFNSCIMLDTPSANIIKHDTWQEYSIVTKKLETGNQIIFTVDGVEYLNVMDTEAPYATEEGYFMITNSGLGEIQIAPVDGETTISQSGISSKPAETVKPEINESADELKEVVLKGNKLTSNIGEKEIPSVYFENTTAMLPLRAVCEYFGGLVNWNGDRKTATISKSGVSVEVTDTFDEYTLNGKYKKASQKVVNKNGSLYIPAEIIAELFGVDLTQNGEEVKLSVK